MHNTLPQRALILLGVFAIVFFLFPHDIAAFETYYTDTAYEYISKGVVYEESRRITDMGLLDVFVLRIPANDPNILLSAAPSQVEPGLKETASNLLRGTGAIAGVNGDYFGMAGSHSMPSGLQVDINGVRSISNNTNIGSRRFSSFMLADDGNYFMDYVNAFMLFLNDGVENIQIGSLNKVSDLAGTSILTADFMPDTSSIDERISDAVKIVVSGGIITYVSAKGETVSIPQDGYIVILSGAYADEVIWQFRPGQRAELGIHADFNLWGLQSAISGGGRILINGQPVSEGQQFASGVHPRTAIGLSSDQKEIILMVVDGRSHSVGVTHYQLAQLMLEAGAYDAMHLDGGGSSEMLITRAGSNELSIVNYPSGGFERRIINALGVYVQAPAGTLHSLVIELPETVIRSVPNRVSVYGLDEYMRRIDIPHGLVNIFADGNSSFTADGFTAHEQGLYTVTAAYGGHTAQATVFATELFEIIPSVKEMKSSVGGIYFLNFSGVGENGNVFTIAPSSVSVEVFPASLGSVMDGVFMAESLGAGWLRCHIGSISAYVPLYVTIQAQLIDQLSGSKPIHFSAVPESANAAAYYTQIPDYFMPVATLMYHFQEADHTQAAYAHFSDITSTAARGFRLSVYGDLSGNWLRGRVVDANGEHYLIDFARVIDWEGWKDVEVWLPPDIAYPITLDRVYVASTSADREINSQLWFSNLRGLYDYIDMYPEVITPPNDRFRDDMHVVFYEFSDYGYDITFMPDASAPSAGRAHESRAMDVFLFNASAGVYTGNFTQSFYNDRHWTLSQNQTHLVEYAPEFNNFGIGNLYIIQLTAAATGGNTGLMFADRTQWGRIKNAIDMSYTTNIMLLMDESPLHFANKKEYDLLHSLLRGYAKRGYNFFVLSSCGASPEVSVIDGVRYMRFGPLYSDGVLNEDFSVLRFRLGDWDIKYSIENIFEGY
ncbi:MAG: phosphodiester glycosidase family protein [Defluviitaleaceae bacterium]|nr:phosphodiester glycosidase family protein [Defluviitaleaceae bacterium]MCL2836284.1 phosphodiester glycosidase family protein [Defluviitaleaceae bacterium]